jgi:LmbE family N-acetylglucosaminyl deacetylase
MMTVSLGPRHPRKILCLGAHSDDIEIGCGGTLLKILAGRKDPHVYWVVFSSDGRREREALKSANDFLRGARRKTVVVKRFRNSFFPYSGAEIKEYFEQLKRDFTPDLVFTHYRDDLHQDHRLISELTWNTFRDHLILEYEIPKYDGDLGSPNFFVHLDEPIGRKKTERILKHFRSQSDKAWFTGDTFISLMRLRGVESNSPGKYAEGFYCRKIAL